MTDWNARQFCKCNRQFLRDDTVTHNGRQIVPTVYGSKDGTNTKWVQSWAEFRSVGGVCHFSEDQTEITLTLPEGWKFGIRFNQESTDAA